MDQFVRYNSIGCFSVIDWNYGTYGTTLDGPGQGYVSLNLDRKGFFSMLLELLISCRYAHNVEGFGLQIFKRIQPYFYQNNNKCLTFNCQNSVKLMNMVIQINSQAHIRSFKHYLWRSQHFYIQSNAACKS